MAVNNTIPCRILSVCTTIKNAVKEANLTVDTEIDFSKMKHKRLIHKVNYTNFKLPNHTYFLSMLKVIS